MAACMRHARISKRIISNFLTNFPSNRFFILPPEARLCSSFSTERFSCRTHNCGELRAQDNGTKVQLYGWLQFQRYGKFITLRDAYGVVQVVIKEDQTDLSKKIQELGFETVLCVKGHVIKRPSGQENKKMVTGDIEILADDVEIVNKATFLPFEIRDYNKANEALRMEYRYLDLRFPEMQKNLRLRSSIIMKMREFLCNKNGFVDVETPTLFRRTPGGAREFIVPTHNPGLFYSLPQSPQQFKQLLMVGGIDRYMQIARCFRDEHNRPDRQPEFTQLDIEMSFVSASHIQNLIEDLMKFCWPENLGKLETPFRKMSYKDAMYYYGTDKPDIRFDDVISRLSDVTFAIKTCGLDVFQSLLEDEENVLKAFVIKNGASHLKNKDFEQAFKSASDIMPKGAFHMKITEDLQWKGSVARKLNETTKHKLKCDLDLKEGDVLVMAVGEYNTVSPGLGKLRLEFANILESRGVDVRPKDIYNFLWVEDFPLFVPKEDGQPGLQSAHHPFTAPVKGHEGLLTTEPEKITGQHYDLVLNGNEVGGGSIRIHDSKMQRLIIEDILQEDSSEFSHLLQALDSGCPPHGGIALGLDRLIAIICGAKSIRDVIAFPKSHDGKDPMSKAPSKVSKTILDFYKIKEADR